MRPVERHDIVDHAAYEDMREAFRRDVLAAKALRRVHVGEHLTFLFENQLTVRYQIREMLRTERITREEDIQHEIDTYNDLLGGTGELGCTLLIEIDDPDARSEKLVQWWALPEKVYVALEDGRRVRARFDPAQRGETRLSSVQYLKFQIGNGIPVAVGTDLPGLQVETRLTEEQQQALREDLAAAVAT